MTSTHPSLAPDPMNWLLARMVEAYNQNVEATIADGFQHAIDTLDQAFDEVHLG